MKEIDKLFFELVRVAIGNADSLSHTPSHKEWKALYGMAQKQSLVGVCFAALQKLGADADEGFARIGMSEMLYLTWMGMAAKIQQRNEVVNQQCVELQARLSAEGLRSCVLKGQGIAQLYGENLQMLRQSGDIDVLVDCDFNRAARFAKNTTGKDVHWAYKDISIPLFDDTEVELHIKPGLMFNPFHNRAWQRWYNENKNIVFVTDVANSFSAPSIGFNLIYILHHCYMHLFESGVGLRQVMDYFFVLRQFQEVSHSTSSGQAPGFKFQEVSNTLKSLGLLKFASAMMWVQKVVFGLEEKYMICEPNEKDGEFLLDEMMQSGNFGKYDTRFHMDSKSKFKQMHYFFKRSMLIIGHYPQESLWMPWYFVWHYIVKFIKR